MPPYLALLLTLIGSNYPCLELIFMVPKVFEPLKFYFICLKIDQDAMVSVLLAYPNLSPLEPGRVAQSVGHLTRKTGVLGSIPGLAT